nr:MAG TPA: hypothetical protein [Caudoviricetes sp.]
MIKRCPGIGASLRRGMQQIPCKPTYLLRL